MTLSSLRWVLLPLLAAAVLAVVTLPPRPMPDTATLFAATLGLGGGSPQGNVETEHDWAIQRARESLLENVAARSHGEADLLAARSGGALRSGAVPELVVIRDGEVPESAARAWLRAAERDAEVLPGTAGAGVTVVLALHTRDPRALGTGGDWQGPYMYRYATDGRVGRGCIVDVVLPPKAEPGRSRFDVPDWAKVGLLGRCALYERWGFPGREVGRWVGLAPNWARYWRWDFRGPWLPGRHLTMRDTLQWQGRWTVPWAELACIRGIDAYCRALGDLGGAAPVGRPPWRYTDPTRDWIVLNLLADRGPERFAAFWTSPLPPDSALSLAYGVSAGALVREAWSRRYVADPPAEVGAGRLLGAAGWVIALAVLAVGLSWRREMDA